MTAPRWKIVTYQEARKSNRRIRAYHPKANLPRGSHLLCEGHEWAISVALGALMCSRCQWRLVLTTVDRWIIERTEDELMQDAEAVLNYLGLKIDKEGRYDETRYDRP